MSKSTAKRFFFSIHVKLFLWFWLITIVSIVATRLVSHQLSSDEFVMPTDKADLRKLNFLERQIDHRPPRSLSHFLDKAPKRVGTAVIAENTSTGEVLMPGEKRFEKLGQYIKKKPFDDLKTIRLQFGRITGPKLIEHKGETYKFYVADRSPPPHFGMLVMQMPAWLRFLIPFSISLVLCWMLARSLSKPIFGLQRAATRLGDGELSARVAEDAIGKDEIGELAKSFNTMAAKLEHSLSAQQRLIADVSHELRSPMTRLQLAIGLAQKSATQPEELEKHLVRSELEVTRLDKMISDVLSLSRLENSIYALHLENIDLRSFFKLIIQDAEFVATTKNIEIQCSEIPDIALNIDSQLFNSAINNVLSNAIKYSPKQSRISVNVVKNAGQLTITINDSGLGVAEDKLAQLFEPFYRVADARDRKTGGTGLGLAIAKQAILAHNGEISARNTDQGLEVNIVIPCEL